MAQFTFIPTAESREVADDLREVFAELDSALRPEQRVYSGECHPALDVLETETAVEVLVDVTGIPVEALRVLFRGDVLLVAGEKAPRPTSPDATFHLVEREFGRFARAVRLNGAFDIPRAQASSHNGVLVIVLPRHTERRGQAHPIAITSDSDPS
jgi:HSP20 family protein